jgi:SAM-dependent methyltransferase
MSQIKDKGFELFKNTYPMDFYSDRDEQTYKSAEIVISYIMNWLKPQTVVDIGCNVGTWLRIFKKYGCHSVLGVDTAAVPEQYLEIDNSEFLAHDLETRLLIDKKFNLAISLEVAEHLDAQYADIFVESLTRLSPIILFSAAIPNQGGINHINEQWQDYWKEKFQRHNYLCIDKIRRDIWNNSNVYYWYRQNILLYVEENYFHTSNLFNQEDLARDMISVVHPETYNLKCESVDKQGILSKLKQKFSFFS